MCRIFLLNEWNEEDDVDLETAVDEDQVQEMVTQQQMVSLICDVQHETSNAEDSVTLI